VRCAAAQDAGTLKHPIDEEQSSLLTLAEDCGSSIHDDSATDSDVDGSLADGLVNRSLGWAQNDTVSEGSQSSEPIIIDLDFIEDSDHPQPPKRSPIPAPPQEKRNEARVAAPTGLLASVYLAPTLNSLLPKDKVSPSVYPGRFPRTKPPKLESLVV